MKIHFGVCLILLGISMGLYRHGLPNRGLPGRGLGARIASASKAGKIGEMSLKSSLSVLSMAGAMALFLSIESALQPDDIAGHKWIEAECAKYLDEVARKEPGWFRKPWTISGSIICFLIIFSGGSLGICHCHKRRNSERQSAGQEHPQPWIVLKEKEKEKGTESGEEKKEPGIAEDIQLRFEDMRMERVSEV